MEILMTIRKIKGKFYYEVMINGKRYNGTCKGCTTKMQAVKFATEDIAQRTRTENDSVEIQIARCEEQIRVLRGGVSIKLSDAFDRALSKSDRQVSAKTVAQNRSSFNDFRVFAQRKYGVIDVDKVSADIARQYILYVRQNGRFVQRGTYIRGNKTIKLNNYSKLLSVESINKIIKVCRWVFSKLMFEAKLDSNPFAYVSLDTKKNESREPFSDEEIRQIIFADDQFCVPLFRIGLYTGLREGDVCCLKWENIDFRKNLIHLTMQKTGEAVRIPILDGEFLMSLYNSSEYVLPEHAKMYQNNKSGITYRLKAFLAKLGIKSTRKLSKRDRVVSVKDFHSCRHTFAVICAHRGISLSVVQAALGHTSPKTTEIYLQHQRYEALQTEFKKFSLFDFKVAKNDIYNSIRLSNSLSEGGESISRFSVKNPRLFKVMKEICEFVPPENLKKIMEELGLKYFPNEISEIPHPVPDCEMPIHLIDDLENVAV